MPRIVVDAHAKINLGLAVVGRRDDGYHDIDTLFQTVSLADTLRIARRPDAGIALRVEGAALPEGPENLAWRAAAALIGRTGCRGVSIVLTKRIPIAAGLGGGSADAAGVLVGMNELLRLGLGLADLREVGLSVGSDVPFLVGGGTARGRGRGEKIEQLPPLRGAWFVLVTPVTGVSAADAYAGARIGLTHSLDCIRLNRSAIQDGDVPALARRLRNDLEAGVVLSCPDVATIRRLLLDAGALGAVMSGSGPTVVGVADSEALASEMASRLTGRDWRVHVVEPIDAGCRVAHLDLDREDA